ncbi:MAG: nitroreductase family protein [Candidatus Lokiarchaeota archaeon]|nr:nitroreductase family protein [Candidatus Harpocratesius repetitus]
MKSENKPPFLQKIGEIFFQQTKYSRNSEIHSKFHSKIQYPYDPSRYKRYSSKKQIFLPKPKEIGSKTPISLYNCVKDRRSYRKFSSTPISAEVLGYLLWLSNGLSKITPNFEYRTATSAGALYPIETYLFINEDILSFLI